MLLWAYLVKMGRGREGGKRTTIQIECPDIIKIPPGVLATKDEELGTDQRHCMVATTARPRPIDHNAGPLSRYWNERSSD